MWVVGSVGNGFRVVRYNNSYGRAWASYSDMNPLNLEFHGSLTRGKGRKEKFCGEFLVALALVIST